MKNKFLKSIFDHKIRTFFIIIILGAAGFYGYQKFSTKEVVTQYITQAAEKGTIIVTVSGSGQVSELDSIDITSQGSGKLTSIKFKTGDLVKGGQVLATIDQASNQKSLVEAKSSLLSAQSDYDDLVKGATESEIKSQQNAINQAESNYNDAIRDLENTKKSTAEDLKQAQEDLDNLLSTDADFSNSKRDTIVSTIQEKVLSTRSVLDSEYKILNDDDLEPTFSAKNLSAANNAKSSYEKAVALLSEAENSLNTVKQNKSDINISSASDDTINLLKKTLDSYNYLYIALQNSVPNIGVDQTEIDSSKSSVNSQITSLNTAITSIETAEQNLADAIKDARNNLATTKLNVEKEISSAESQVKSSLNTWESAKDKMADLKTPATETEKQIALSRIKTARATLVEAQDNFNDNIITVPFDGKLAEVSAQKGDVVGQSTIIANLITTQNIATIPLNEVDTAKINLGDKVNLTFDAVEDLTITGKIINIDTVGTVSSGVVTYNVDISFDTQDERIKPGMSVNATIITDAKADVVMVPNSAIKTENSGSYLQTLNADGQPRNVIVETGLANDTYTEIVQGLNEGDKVVTQTVTLGATAAKTTNSNNSSRGGMGGMMMMGGGGPRD